MIKKLFDFIFVIILIPIWFPLILTISITSLILNGRPVFFFQYRGGYKNKKIKINKFITKDKNKNINFYNNILRFFKLDELPQIINILKGDISLVGPDHCIMNIRIYTKKHLKRFNVMPGITGWSQINSTNKMTWLRKFDYDIWYVENCNFFLDLKILLLTFKKISLSLFVKNKKSNPIKKFNGSN